jgi:hypothetical protein
MHASIDSVFTPSDDIVAREIDGETIIVPLTTGIGDMEDDLFTLNETGTAIWRRLDGRTTLRSVAAGLAEEYAAPQSDIERDVLGLVSELARRGMLIEVATA